MNKAIIFDLDGTIYIGDKIAPYALETVEKLKSIGYEVIFLTNNSTKTRGEILEKLEKLNISTTLNRIYSSSFATCNYLSKENINNIFLIGTKSFQNELEAFDINITEDADCEAVVVGLNKKFNYSMIATALEAVLKGAKLIASNIDKNFPVGNNLKLPGSNAIVASIEGCSGKKVDYIVGKPNTYLLESIVKDWDLVKENIFVVGDSMESDIAMANNFGCKSLLVHNKTNTLKDIFRILQEE